LICVILSTFTIEISAQPASSDNVFYKNAVNNAIKLYHQSSGDQSGIYNGSQYGGYNFPFKEGHPYFSTDQFTMGSIEYDGVVYDSVMLLYDEIIEVVVMQNVVIRVQLITDKIAGFKIVNNNFIRIVKDSNSSSLISTGFYNLLYEGNITLLKKEVKSIREQITNTDGLLRFVDQKIHYYIKEADTYHTIKRKKDLLELFSSHKKQVQQYIRENHLSYRKDRDNTLIKVTAYYDGLKK
jgi:hypothetical protein